MASMNCNDNGGSRSPDTVICDNLRVLKDDKNSADSAYDANGTLQKSKETVRRYKICCLSKAEESLGVYQDIMTCIALGNTKKTGIIEKSVDDYIKKDDEIEKLIKESSKLLNEMRVKLEEAHNASCAMKNCIKNKILSKSGKPIKDDVDVAKAGEALNDILEKAKKLDEKGQNAFESAVVIAGIQSFTNTGSLKDFAKNVATSVKTFKDCIDTNIQSTGNDVKTVREELNEIVENLTQIICDKKAEKTKSKGLDSVMDFVCCGDCDDDCLDLCKDIKECLECGDGDENEGSKKRKGNKKQSADKD